MAYKDSDFGIYDEKEIRAERKEKGYKIALIIRSTIIGIVILAGFILVIIGVIDVLK